MALTDTGTTLLIIPQDANGGTLAPYSARGLTQSLQLVQGQNDVDRTINAELIDLTDAAFRKYKTVISCKDVRTPCLDGAYLGQTVTIHCITRLSYLTDTGSPSRPEVPYSVFTEGAVTYYNPIITFLITNIQNSLDEYPDDNAWQIEGEEV